MDSFKLLFILREISGLNDFFIELRESYSKSYWGRYYVAKKLIVVFTLDENGEYLPEKDIIRTVTHELTHHIQWHHTPGWERRKGVMHDAGFKKLHKQLLDRFYSFMLTKDSLGRFYYKKETC